MRLSKTENRYSISANTIHAESIAKHFLTRSVRFVRQRNGSLEFCGVQDSEYLSKILGEWKENFVSGGEQYL